MRASFREQLDSVRGALVVMAATVTSAITWASAGLLEGDLPSAKQAIATAGEVDEGRREVESRVHDLLARQQPVAVDLRLTLVGLQVAGDLARMGALAAHIAKIMVLSHPTPAVPPSAAEVIRSMARVAEQLAWTMTRVLEVGDVAAARQLDRDDDEMDALHVQLFEVLFQDWTYGVKSAVDIALIGRFYERYADHAVNAGRQVAFLVSGDDPNA